ncbi:MAG: hypothetical protein O7E52_06355 [Candidatus Poribacteria bacterium]|nr:hypothetical protein [Candidatus Poribacteria bacterium]
MIEANPVFISGAVEGDVDEAVLRRLVRQVGASPSTVYGKKGKPHLLQKISAYNQAANISPWLILVDLDQDADCAPFVRESWLPNPAPNICFRVVVREVESWLLADSDRLAQFLSVPVSQIPPHPETIGDPKLTMVSLARRSRRRDIREDMVPRPKSGREVGPAYTSRLIEFTEDAENGWRPDVAAKSSESLDRCLRCIRRLVNRGSTELSRKVTKIG